MQRQAVNSAEPATIPPAVHQVLRSPGRPLDTATRAFMEPRFGHDLSQVKLRTSTAAAQTDLAIGHPGDRYEQEAEQVAQHIAQAPSTLATTGPHEANFANVRIHTDAMAAASARALDARAYTAGHHIVFDTGQYAPDTPSGKSLLAHELTHVVQQTGETLRPTLQPWRYGSGTHATGGGNTFRELTEEERTGSNGIDNAMTIVDRLASGTDWRARHCQKWYDDNCTVNRSLSDIHDRAAIWAWRDGDGASGWGLTDGSNGVHHAVTDQSLDMRSRWFLASVIVHEYWHDCDTAGDADIGNEAERVCGLPGFQF